MRYTSQMCLQRKANVKTKIYWETPPEQNSVPESACMYVSKYKLEQRKEKRLFKINYTFYPCAQNLKWCRYVPMYLINV